MDHPDPTSPGPVYAGFASRAVAFVLDLILLAAAVAVVGALLQMVVGFFGVGRHMPVDTGTLYAGGTAIGFLMQAVYFIFFWSAIGQTPGKILLGLQVVTSNGRPPSVLRAVVRYVGYWVSAICLGLGFLWVLVDRRRQGWHDKLAGTAVVRTAESIEYHRRIESARRSERQ
jgi:uncharacterized RDD family membrane protein YckC